MTQQEDVIKTAQNAKDDISAIVNRIAGLKEHSFTCDLLVDAMGECDYIIKSAKRGWNIEKEPFREGPALCEKAL